MNSGIYKIKLRQPDRFIMWLKFTWFKHTKPKEYQEMKKWIENVHTSALDGMGINIK